MYRNHTLRLLEESARQMRELSRMVTGGEEPSAGLLWRMESIEVSQKRIEPIVAEIRCMVGGHEPRIERIEEAEVKRRRVRKRWKNLAWASFAAAVLAVAAAVGTWIVDGWKHFIDGVRAAGRGP